MDKQKLALFSLFVAVIFGGLGGIFGKLALRYFTPTSTVFIRFSLALMILIPLTVRSGQYLVKKKDLLPVLATSFFWTLNVFGFIVGLQYTTAIMSQLVYLLVPLIVLLLSKFFSKEKILAAQIFGVVLGITGGLLILTGSLTGNPEEILHTFGSFKGNLVILLAAVSWSFYLFFSKKMTIKYSPLVMTTYSSLLTLLLAGPLFLKDLNLHQLPSDLGADGLVGILGLAFINSVGMLFLYQWGIKNSSAFAAASVGPLSPLVAALIAIPLFGEQLTPLLILSGATIFTGVYLATIYPVLKNHKNRKRL
ncbi:EamA family transporter [Candidatus Woesebacteria bacterium]|nr:EamA family transporter [Candidatus Woesebacteria bacterium]